MTSLTMIEITPEDFLKGNRGLIRLLLTLYECGNSLPTRLLYQSTRMSCSHGDKTMRKAQRLGYITRYKVPKGEGQKGNHQMINKLTPRAIKLLRRLELP